MPKDLSKLFEEPGATYLEERRAEARTKGRVLYDCFNAVVIDNRVFCRREHIFLSSGKGKDGSLSLLSVLRGRTSRVCRNCPDFDDGGER